MKSIKFKTGLMLLLFAAPLFFCVPAQAGEYIEGSAQALFFQEPATIHNFKNPSDLHNRIAALLAITELEFTRIGDITISFVSRSRVRPLEHAVNSISAGYGHLPQSRPVRRVGELFDAVQIPELSLSDARSIILLTGGSNSGALAPIMQMRIYKLLIWVEDILYDVDDLVMLPVNYPVSKIRGKDTDLKTVGYAGNAVGYARAGIFTVLRTASRYIVRFSSSALKKVEGGFDAVVRAKRKRENANYPIFARMTYDVYESHLDYFKEKQGELIAGNRDGWQQALRPGIDLGGLMREENSENISIEPPHDEPVFVISRAKAWRGAPEALLPFVVTEGEFKTLLSGGEI